MASNVDASPTAGDTRKKAATAIGAAAASRAGQPLFCGPPGLRVRQAHLALYALSGFIAGVTGLVDNGRVKTPSLSLARPLGLPSLAAAGVGGTPILGGRGGYGGTIIGARILTVTALDVRLTEKN